MTIIVFLQSPLKPLSAVQSRSNETRIYEESLCINGHTTNYKCYVLENDKIMKKGEETNKKSVVLSV